MNVLAVILARGGSTRIPQKNLAELGCVPLCAHAAIAAHEAELVTHAVVSTDDPRIAAVCGHHGADWIKRPSEISGPSSTIEQAVCHAMLEAETREGITFDFVVSLQAAVPIRPYGAIDALVREVASKNLKGGVTVVRRSPWSWRINGEAAQTWWNPTSYPRSQDIPSVFCEEINSIQVTPRNEVICGKRWRSPVALMELPRWCDIDIDVQEDLDYARAAWPMISKRLHADTFEPRFHVVNHGQRTDTKFPMYEPWFPEPGSACGVVLGNGPQLDELPGTFWKSISNESVVSIGMNRVCCSDAIVRNDFYPTLHTIWDCPEVESADAKAMRAGSERLKGRTWRCVSRDSANGFYPHDQVLGLADSWNGPASEAYMRHSSADLCVNLLYRLGLREIYVYGVELNSVGYCKTVAPIEHKARCSDPNWYVPALNAFRDAVKWPGLKLYCGCKTSRLVTNGVLEFREVSQ